MIHLRQPVARRQHYQSPVAWLAVSFILAGCQAVPQPGVAVPDAPPLPDAPAYVIDPAASELRLLVRRDGPLAALGHDHVVTAPLNGVIHAGETAADSGFHLEVDVSAFAVDPPLARAGEGGRFAAAVSDDARRGTRENLLGPELLDAKNHPRIVIDAVELAGPRWNPDVTARVTLRGATRAIEFPAAVFAGDGRLTVIARFTIRQSDFGIEPFSALGGALRVKDAVDVRVKVTANRKSGAENRE